MTQAWKAALAQPDPGQLLGLAGRETPPERVNGVPWPEALALRVAREQWCGENWLTPHYEEWMHAWTAQSKQPGFSISPGSLLIFSLLEQMGQMEALYQPGQMHVPRWVEFVDTLTGCGMAIDRTHPMGKHALNQLLTHTTIVPYPGVARHWMEQHHLCLPRFDAGQILALLDRLMPGASTGRVARLPDDGLWLMEQALSAADPQGIAKAFHGWANRNPGRDIEPLCRLAVALELESQAPAPGARASAPRL